MMRAAAVLNLLSLIFFFSILLIGIILNLRIKEQIPGYEIQKKERESGDRLI